MITRFYDSATEANLPSGQYVMLPADGTFEVTGPVSRFAAVRWYTVKGDYRRAGGIDWEHGNPAYSPARLRGFVRGRRAMNTRARVYVDRADAADALRALADGGHGQLGDYSGLYWWISTLDGVEWTAEDLAADLARNWDAPIAADRIWACQNKGGITAKVDESILYLDW